MIRNKFLTVILMSFCMGTQGAVEIRITRSPNWLTFFQKVVNKSINNLPSAVISAALGAVSGSLVALIDNNCLPASLLMAWPAEMYLRNIALESIEEEMDTESIAYNRQTMYWVACIASWIGWLMCVQDKNPTVAMPRIIIRN